MSTAVRLRVPPDDSSLPAREVSREGGDRGSRRTTGSSVGARSASVLPPHVRRGARGSACPASAPDAPALPLWTRDVIAGRLVELSDSGGGAPLTMAVALVLDAQRRRETVAWVTSRESAFFPPDVAASGVDLAALVVVRLPGPAAFADVFADAARRGGPSPGGPARDRRVPRDGDSAVAYRSRLGPTSSGRSPASAASPAPRSGPACGEIRPYLVGGAVTRATSLPPRSGPAAGPADGLGPATAPAHARTPGTPTPAARVSAVHAAAGRIAAAQAAARAAERLLRSGAFGLVLLDLGTGDVAMPLQARLLGLAERHGAAIVCITEKPSSAPSLSSLVSLRVETHRRRTADGVFVCTVQSLKDKRRAPGWSEEEVRHGAAGLR